MPIPLPTDTAELLGPSANRCESRSLFFDKFADPSAKDSGAQTPRTDWFNRLIRLKPILLKRDLWSQWLGELGLASSDLVLANLQSRLIVNAAGGVMENAGLCLDRFGVPYIPGSAVKGCARRMAIQLLIAARGTNRPVDELARLLADIAVIFGWSQNDWGLDKDKRGCLKSDFAYGVGVDKWPAVCRITRSLVLGVDPEKPEDFGHFAGAVCFLPAYARELPANDLELDVVTCHHPKYYQRERDLATDDEEPNPVKFMAVAAGTTFAFATLALRGERASISHSGAKLHILARDWLREGLNTFGLGAKTAAGYGWLEEVHAPKTTSTVDFADKSDSVTQPGVEPAEHPVISKWRGHATPDNFRVLLPDLAAVENTQELRHIFEAVIPETERNRLWKDKSYWQSFSSRPQGRQILQRLGIILK